MEDDDEEKAEVAKPVEVQLPQSEVINIRSAKETAETSHLTTSEQEENQTFVITGRKTAGVATMLWCHCH